jgi:hypothetical protein
MSVAAAAGIAAAFVGWRFMRAPISGAATATPTS